MGQPNLDNFDETELKKALAKLGVADEELGMSGSDDLDAVTDVEEQTEEPEEIEEVEEPVSKKVLSKEEKAILKLKSELKEERKIRKAYEDAQKEKEEQSKKSSLIERYKSKGYDDEDAERYANTDITIKSLQERVLVQDFREENAEALGKYPQAKTDIRWLMDSVEKTGLSVEQLCLAKYGNASNETAYDRRAREAMSGSLDESGNEDRVSTATRTATRPATTGMTTKDVQNKEWLEGITGQKMTPKEYLTYKTKHNL